MSVMYSTPNSPRQDRSEHGQRLPTTAPCLAHPALEASASNGPHVLSTAGTSTAWAAFFTSKVFYAQLSSSGVGPWTETTDYGAASGTTGSGGIPGFQISCVSSGGYIYCVGNSGGTSKVYYAQLSSSGVGPWTETTDYGATTGNSGTGGLQIGATACVADAGYIYCIGGTMAFNPVSDVFYATLSSSGVGAWTESTDYGASSGSTGSGGEPVFGADCVLYSPYVICLGGQTTGHMTTAHVYYGKDEEILGWIITDDYVGPTYWDDCISALGYIFCWGQGSVYGWSAPIQTTGSSTTTSTTTTSTTSNSTKMTPILYTSLNPSTTINAGGQAYDSAGFASIVMPASGTVQYYRYSGPGCTGTQTALGEPVNVGSDGSVPNSPFTTFPNPGTYSYSAHYGGDNNNNPTDSMCETLAVVATPATSQESTAVATTPSGGGGNFSLLEIGVAIVAILIALGALWFLRGRGGKGETGDQTKPSPPNHLSLPLPMTAGPDSFSAVESTAR